MSLLTELSELLLDVVEIRRRRKLQIGVVVSGVVHLRHLDPSLSKGRGELAAGKFAAL